MTLLGRKIYEDAMLYEHPLKRGGGLSFRNFSKREGGSKFSHKKGGVGNIGGFSKKEGEV